MRRGWIESAQQLGEPLDAFDEVFVAERERHPGVPGRAERLAGDHRHFRLVEGELAELEAGRRGVPGDVAAEEIRERREAVERPLGWEATNARDGGEQLVHG